MPKTHDKRGRLRRGRGLSRLEFAVAVMIIGVLLWVLLPRLVALHAAARPVRLQTALGTVRAGAAVFHGRCLAAQATAATPAAADAPEPCAWLSIDGVTVEGRHGWPAPTAAGIARAAALPLQARPGAEAFVLSALQVRGTPALRIALPAPRCAFTYVQATPAGAEPLIESLEDACE